MVSLGFPFIRGVCVRDLGGSGGFFASERVMILLRLLHRYEPSDPLREGRMNVTDFRGCIFSTAFVF